MVIRGESQVVRFVLLEKESLEGDLKRVQESIRQLSQESILRDDSERIAQGMSINRNAEQHSKDKPDQAESAFGFL